MLSVHNLALISKEKEREILEFYSILAGSMMTRGRLLRSPLEPLIYVTNFSFFAIIMGIIVGTLLSFQQEISKIACPLMGE